MQRRTVALLWLLCLGIVGERQVFAADFKFRHHFICRELPVTDKGVGDYGLTALVDVDDDGDLDFAPGGTGQTRLSRRSWGSIRKPSGLGMPWKRWSGR